MVGGPLLFVCLETSLPWTYIILLPFRVSYSSSIKERWYTHVLEYSSTDPGLRKNLFVSTRTDFKVVFCPLYYSGYPPPSTLHPPLEPYPTHSVLTFWFSLEFTCWETR